jgi:hypothetical protein
MTGWFPGEGRNADDEAFLGELRTLALHEGLADVRPEDTTIHSTPEGAEPLILYFRVPGLPPSKADPTLQIAFSWSGSDPFLVGTWEVHGYLLDLFDDIDTSGVERTPEAFARRAFEWLHEQLRRPVELHEWTVGSRPPRREWRLLDPEEPLVLLRSGWPFRRRREEPDRVVRLR